MNGIITNGMSKFLIKSAQAHTLRFLFAISFIFFTAMLSHVNLGYAQEFATDPGLTGGIVSCSGIRGQDGLPPCNWCTFIQLIGNLVQYSIYAAVMLSSIMFAYAGFLFLFNNGKSENVTKALSIFRMSLLGIVGILMAWLIINAIMTKLAVGLGLQEKWNTIKQCADTGQVTRVVNPPMPIRGTASRYDDIDPYPGNAYTYNSAYAQPYPLTDNRSGISISPDLGYKLPSGYKSPTGRLPVFSSPARVRLSDAGFKFNTECVARFSNGVKNQGTCVDKLKAVTVSGALQMKSECDLYKGGCEIVITGGNEKYASNGRRTHAGGTRSHANGYKLDFRLTDDINDYIQNSGNFKCKTPGGFSGSSMECVRKKENIEIVCNKEWNHWDCKF